MSGSQAFVIVYNNGNDTIELDNETGLLLAPRDWACARRSKVSDGIGNGSLITVNPDTIIETMSNPLAWAAKQAYDKACSDYDAAQAAASTDQAGPSTDYDKSTEDTTSKTTTSKTKK